MHTPVQTFYHRGLQQHVMHNWTINHLPGPTEKLKVNVRQSPGLSYPKQPHHVNILERNAVQRAPFVQQPADKTYILPGEMPPATGHGFGLGHGAPCDSQSCDPGSSASCQPGSASTSDCEN